MKQNYNVRNWIKKQDILLMSLKWKKMK
jgi:hypothetical protein